MWCRNSAPELTVLDGGECPGGIESAIVDCTAAQPALLRPGLLDRARCSKRVLGVPLRERGRAVAARPRQPEVALRTGAPRATDEHAAAAPMRCELLGPQAAQPRLAVYSRVPAAGRARRRARLMPDDPAAAAHELFAVLRGFDAQGVAARSGSSSRPTAPNGKACATGCSGPRPHERVQAEIHEQVSGAMMKSTGQFVVTSLRRLGAGCHGRACCWRRAAAAPSRSTPSSPTRVIAFGDEMSVLTIDRRTAASTRSNAARRTRPRRRLQCQRQPRCCGCRSLAGAVRLRVRGVQSERRAT